MELQLPSFSAFYCNKCREKTRKTTDWTLSPFRPIRSDSLTRTDSYAKIADSFYALSLPNKVIIRRRKTCHQTVICQKTIIFVS